MGWTKQQEKAIYTSGHNIIVSAGAGSGKTAVLSERVLEFVKNHSYRIDQFLILTFTNLAAAEMKERIRQKLDANGLKEASNDVDTADIGTFDSFAASIVKKYHFLLNLSPKLNNVDSTVMSIKKRSIIEDIFSRLYQEHNAPFEKMISDLCFKDDEDIKELILKIHDTSELELDKEEFLNNFIEKYYSDEFMEYMISKFEEILYLKKKAFLEYLENLPDVIVNAKTQATFYSVSLDNAEVLRNAYTYDSLLSAFNTFKFPRWPKDCEEDKSTVEVSKLFLENLKKNFIKKIPSSKNEVISVLKKQKEYAEVLISITKELDERQWEYKLEKQVFEFNDIAKFALKLVKENKDVRDELTSKYKMIMIDEYQDTSLLQESFVSYIQNNNVYMVGDIKQSIYAFRNARSDIFKDKYDSYKLGKETKVFSIMNREIKEVPEAIDMNTNFRSRNNVLQDINKMFSIIMNDELGGANYKKDHIIDFGNKMYSSLEANEQNYDSEFILYDGVKGQEKVDYEIVIIAKDIIKKINNGYEVFVPPKKDKDGNEVPEHLRKASFKDFCILIDRGRDFERFKKIFTQYKIPLYIEQDENIKENVIVRLLKNLLVLIDYLINEKEKDNEFILSFLSVSRSFVCNYNDEKIYRIVKEKDYDNTPLIKTLTDFINNSKELSSYLLLEKVLDELQVYSKLVLIGDVKKNEIYLDEFMKYFKQMSDLDYSIEEFISYFDHIDEYNLKITLPATGSSLDSVKIMNIHKSKGLEFPVVYFPRLDSEFNKIEKTSKYSVCSRFGLILPLNSIDHGPTRTLENYYKNIDEISERIRLLYVALTRAKEKMIFISNTDSKDKELDEVKSFQEILNHVYKKFNHYPYDYFEKVKPLNIVNSMMIHDKLIIHSTNFNHEVIEKTRASKELKIGTNKLALKRGIDLHEILEVIDFKNPDYSFISNNFYKSRVYKFINSPLLKDVNNAKIFKEYEFIDNETRGIIDLMLVYDDHIDIIDYKTKNIDDLEYDNQVKIYRDYISKISSLPIRLYLYSIIDGTYREIK